MKTNFQLFWHKMSITQLYWINEWIFMISFLSLLHWINRIATVCGWCCTWCCCSCCCLVPPCCVFFVSQFSLHFFQHRWQSRGCFIRRTHINYSYVEAMRRFVVAHSPPNTVYSVYTHRYIVCFTKLCMQCSLWRDVGVCIRVSAAICISIYNTCMYRYNTYEHPCFCVSV